MDEELQVGDEVEILYWGDKGKRGKIVEIESTPVYIVDVNGTLHRYGKRDSLKKIIEKLKVGDIVEVLFDCDAKGKRGNITRITDVFYVKIEGEMEVFSDSKSLKKIKKDTCTCDRIFLFNNGCKCGHWERQKNANSKSQYRSRWQQAIKRL